MWFDVSWIPNKEARQEDHTTLLTKLTRTNLLVTPLHSCALFCILPASFSVLLVSFVFYPFYKFPSFYTIRGESCFCKRTKSSYMGSNVNDTHELYTPLTNTEMRDNFNPLNFSSRCLPSYQYVKSNTYVWTQMHIMGNELNVKIDSRGRSIFERSANKMCQVICYSGHFKGSSLANAHASFCTC